MSRLFASTDRIAWSNRTTPTAITFSCFVKAQGATPWTTSFPRASEWGGGGTVFNINTTGTPVLRMERGGISQSQGLVGLDDGGWHHLVWTSDSTDESFWMDGVQITNATTGATSDTTTGTLWLGNRISDSARPLDMQMSYASAYNTVLTSTQIGDLGDQGWLDIAALIFQAGADVDHDAVADTAGTITGTTLVSNDNPLVTPPDAQQEAPDSTVAAGGWTASGAASLHLAIFGLGNDADFAVSATNPTNDLFEVGLTDATDPGTDEHHIVRYRYSTDGGARQIDLTARLLQGATVIASWSHVAIPSTVTQADQLLTTTEAGNITDYTDLRLDFSATSVGGGAGTAARIYGAVLEVPAAVVGGAQTLSASSAQANLVASSPTLTPGSVTIAPSIAVMNIAAAQSRLVSVPLAPTNLVAGTPTTTSVVLTWTDNATSEDRYAVELSTDQALWAVVIDNLPANTVEYELTGLDPDTVYFTRVRAGITTTAALGSAVLGSARLGEA